MKRVSLRLFKFCSLLLGALVLFLVGCQSSLIYFPRKYEPEELGGMNPPRCEHLSWTTDQGEQIGTLARPLSGKPAQRLWLVCAGNGSLALDLRDWLELNSPAEDAHFYLDYPGYGRCQGRPTPEHIRQSLRQAVPLAMAKLGWSLDKDAERLRVFGHSLGAANALQAAAEFRIRRGVLLSPFTNMADMANHQFFPPVGMLVYHKFDNRASFRSIVAARPDASYHMFHGSRDGVIPHSQSVELHAEFTANTTFRSISGGDHNDLLDIAEKEIAACMKE